MDEYIKCYYCNKVAVAERREAVDADVDYETDEVTGETITVAVPIYATIQVCVDHMNDDDERLD